MTDLEPRDRALVGEVLPPGPGDTPPGSGARETMQRLGYRTEANCGDCGCDNSRLGAAGWTPPGQCAGGCR